MVVMKDCIVTIKDTRVSEIDSNAVIKREVENRTYVGYLNPSIEQTITGEFGFFKVYDGLSLRKEFKLTNQASIDSAFQYIRELKLEPNLETELQVFLLDIEAIGTERQKMAVV